MAQNISGNHSNVTINANRCSLHNRCLKLMMMKINQSVPKITSSILVELHNCTQISLCPVANKKWNCKKLKHRYQITFISIMYDEIKQYNEAKYFHDIHHPPFITWAQIKHAVKPKIMTKTLNTAARKPLLLWAIYTFYGH